MITGSFASNLHGVPRATFDTDIVSTNALEKFLSQIRKNFYIEYESALDIIDKQKVFDIIHYKTGFKFDIIPIKNRNFSKVEFQRKQQIEFIGLKCWFLSPEDTILAKLEWSKADSLEIQFNDASGIAKIQKKKLDWEYLNKWACELSVSELLKKIKSEIKNV
ncbi:MAG: hypothetical protein N3A65_09455 [candidate division WOR-3 bacterium]|nr:hypothetical protein [candidate division WOR-3 bacterium]